MTGIEYIINKLEECDDFHDRCDCLLEHDEITYLLEYINELIEYQEVYYGEKEIVDKAIEYIENTSNNGYIILDVKEDLLKILKGESNDM